MNETTRQGDVRKLINDQIAALHACGEVFRIRYDLGIALLCDRIVDGRVEPLSLVIGPEEIARPLLDALRDGRAVLLIAQRCGESPAAAPLLLVHNVG